jgi:ABC-2 type transport system ATP-binding protein
VTALADLTMTVPRGEIFGFLGPNGAGKTTAVKLLLGLTYPTAGDAFVLGAPLGDIAPRRRIGYLPELFRYQDFLSAREVLELHCVLAGLERAKRRAQVDSVLAAVGLEQRARDRVGTYSKGMQQRLGLAVALVGDPELIFLDEPTSALDPIGRREIREILRGLKSRGVTVFLNSHLLTEVEHVCDRVAIVDRGSVVAIGPLSELVADSTSVCFALEALTEAHASILRAYGDVTVLNGSYSVAGMRPEHVPDAVEALVRGGARIRSVEPRRGSLEDHFLRLLQGSANAAARDR